MKRDERSFRVALMADRYVNPAPGDVDGVAAAAQAGWGVLQLPPDDYPAELVKRLLLEVSEQVEEFARHGYDLVLVGGCDGLAGALAEVGLALPDSSTPLSTAELVDFFSARPIPRAMAELGELAGDQVQAGCVGLHAPEGSGPLRCLDVGRAGRGHVER